MSRELALDDALPAEVVAEELPPPPDPRALLAELDAALAATVDAHLRLRRVARFVREASPAEVAMAVEHAAKGCVEGGWRRLFVTFAHWLLHARPRPRFPVGHWPLPDDELAPAGSKIAEIIEYAVDKRLRYAWLLLRDAFARIAPDETRLLQLHPSVEKWPLGWRRERARGFDATQQQFLLLDTTPAVVQLLAENPRTLEPQAVQIASLRPQHPWALQSLLLQPRWLGNERVCEAVVRNNSAPSWLVLLLAPLLPRKTQMALVHLQWIDADVRMILGDWHGVLMTQIARLEPGAAVEIEQTDDLTELMRQIAEDGTLEL